MGELIKNGDFEFNSKKNIVPLEKGMRKYIPVYMKSEKQMSLISEISSDLNSKELAHFVSLCII